MFISVMKDRESGNFLWEVMNGLYERVNHGIEPTESLAREKAEKAKESYLYWLNYYRYRSSF